MSVESSQNLEGLAYEIVSHAFKLRADVPEKLGGKDSAPEPHDYIEIALAACTCITLQMFANRKEIPLDSVDVKIKIIEEGTVNRIQREIKLNGTLSEEQKTILFSIAEKCPIHKFLSSGAKIESRLV